MFVVFFSRFSHLSEPTTSSLKHAFRLAYFLASSQSSSHTSHLAPLKQCLHLDPDSLTCNPASTLIKDNDWMGVVKLEHVAGSSKDFPGDVFASSSTFEDPILNHSSSELLASCSSVPVPDPQQASPRRAHILWSMYRVYEAQFAKERRGVV